MTGKDEELAAFGHSAQCIFARQFSRFPRRILVLAAVAAAIFIFDVCLMRREPEYRVSSPDVVSASGCFQSLISTLLWLIGFCLVVSGGFRYFRASKIPRNDISYDRMESSAQRRLLAGTLMITFP